MFRADTPNSIMTKPKDNETQVLFESVIDRKNSSRFIEIRENCIDVMQSRSGSRFRNRVLSRSYAPELLADLDHSSY